MPGYYRDERTETVVRYTVNLHDGYACGGYVAEAIQHAYQDKQARGLVKGSPGVDEVRVVAHDDELHIEYRVEGPLPPATRQDGDDRG